MRIYSPPHPSCFLPEYMFSMCCCDGGGGEVGGVCGGFYTLGDNGVITLGDESGDDSIAKKSNVAFILGEDDVGLGIIFSFICVFCFS